MRTSYRLEMTPQILSWWRMFSTFPGGKYVFSRFLGVVVPYSGTVGAVVSELSPGHCKIILKEKRKVRNHLKSVHAIALANLGELATGLAFLTALPPNARGIVVSFKIDYFKKARGRLFAEATVNPMQTIEEKKIEVPAEIINARNEIVARVTATWKIGAAKS